MSDPSTQFPKECSGCKKKLGGEDYDEFYSVYQCRKDHWIVCCKVDCQRLLDKRCSKVSEGLHKMQHKLNNDGHTSALRRLPPAEREKLKQYQEADGKNLLICPVESKAAERSVPYCSYVMLRKGGYGKQTAAGQDLAPDEVVLEDPSDSPVLPDEDQTRLHGDTVLDDDMLLEIKRDDEDADDVTPASKKTNKGSKNKSQKKQKNIITLDWGPSMDEVYPEAPSTKPAPPAPWFTDPTTRNINGTAVSQAWNAASNERKKNATIAGDLTQRPADFKERVCMLMSTTGCTEDKAKELLEQNNHRLETAADAYFRQEAEHEEPNDTKPRWGPRAGGPPETQAKPQSANSQAPHSDQVADANPVPPELPPSQPPPPRLPAEWQALWNQDQGAYYFWHVPTNHTTWDPPALDEDEEPEQAEAAEAARRQAEEEGRTVMVERVSSITCLDLTAARGLLESHGWNLAQAVQSHNKKQQEERDRQQAAERRARDLEAQRRKAEEEEARAAEAARVRELEAEQERQRRSQEGDQLDRYPRQSDLPAYCTCNQNWQNYDDNSSCIRVLKGERVKVLWMDNASDGWAYGNPVDDEEKKGYIPRAILDKVRTGHTPGPRSVGALFSVRDSFKAPDEVQGYLTVGPGDLLKVLHPLDPPYVWAFAELVKYNGNYQDLLGWVPEDILCESSESER